MILFKKVNQLLVYGLILSISFINFGCEKESISPEDSEDEYYVKYKFATLTGADVDVIYRKANNENYIVTVYPVSVAYFYWDVIIGPVSKTFNAKLSLAAEDDLQIDAYIFVSKNNSPFALQKSDESIQPRDAVSISYTIDY